jgi:hypothetical protein
MSSGGIRRIDALQKVADDLMARCVELERRVAQFEAAKQPERLGNMGNPTPAAKKRGHRGR